MHSGQTETIEKPVAGTTNESQSTASIERPDTTANFADRHIGPSQKETAEMLRELGFGNVDALLDATVPKNIRLGRPLRLPEAKSENEALTELRSLASENKLARSFIGAGYSDTI